jgi:hypothetical protein
MRYGLSGVRRRDFFYAAHSLSSPYPAAAAANGADSRRRGSRKRASGLPHAGPRCAVPISRGSIGDFSPCARISRAGDGLAERWSWSLDRQSVVCHRPRRGKLASSELDAVAAAFAAANPGFTLRVDSAATQSGGADRRLERECESVGRAAAACAEARSSSRFGASSRAARRNTAALRACAARLATRSARQRSPCPGAFCARSGARLRFSSRTRR